MIGHIVKIEHVYQDRDNPHIQEVTLNCDYACAYAFFKALISEGKSFSVDIDRRGVVA